MSASQEGLCCMASEAVLMNTCDVQDALQQADEPTCASYRSACPQSDVTLRPPHCCSYVPCRQRFQFFVIILSPERFFRNMFPSFSSILFVCLSSRSVHLCRLSSLQVMAIWGPSLHTLFLLTNKLRICFPTAVHAGDIWDSNFEL